MKDQITSTVLEALHTAKTKGLESASLEYILGYFPKFRRDHRLMRDVEKLLASLKKAGRIDCRGNGWTLRKRL